MNYVRRCEFLGHETQFDEGPHVVLQQPVVNLVNVGEVVDRMAFWVFVVQPYFIMENGVKANVLKIGDGFHFAQVMAITLTQTKDRAAGAEHLLPKMRERMGRPLRVHLNHFDRLAVLRMRLANPGEGEKRAQHAYVKEHWFHARFHHEKDSAS